MNHDTHTETNGFPDTPTLSAIEVARILGVGKNAVYAAVKDGRIPTVGLTKRVRIPTQWVKRHLTDWTQPL